MEYIESDLCVCVALFQTIRIELNVSHHINWLKQSYDRFNLAIINGDRQ